MIGYHEEACAAIYVVSLKDNRRFILENGETLPWFQIKQRETWESEDARRTSSSSFFCQLSEVSAQLILACLVEVMVGKQRAFIAAGVMAVLLCSLACVWNLSSWGLLCLSLAWNNSVFVGRLGEQTRVIHWELLGVPSSASLILQCRNKWGGTGHLCVILGSPLTFDTSE